MATHDTIQATIEQQDIKLLRLLFVNNSGVPRGRVLDAADIEELLVEGTNLTKGMQSFTAHDALVEGGMFGPVGEVRLMPDPSSFTVLPYADRTAIMLCDMHTLDGTPWEADPRSRLGQYLDTLESERGLTLEGSFESEYYLTNAQEDTKPYDDSLCFAVEGMDTAHEIVLDTIDALEAQGLGLSNYYPEYGPGQQELVIEHDQGLAAADNYIKYKRTVNAVAKQHGVDATFAPQPFDGCPGSGCHLHLSMWEDGTNRFRANSDDRYGLSEFGRRFVAGVLDHAPALVGLTAPTAQSYDRLQPGMWASAFTCWGPDNREACVRVPSANQDGLAASTRIEFKPCDNTANPYLALLGIVAAGMDGVDRELELGAPTTTDPATLSSEQRESRGINRLPTNLGAAIDALEADSCLRDALGPTLHDAYIEVKQTEWNTARTDEGDWDGEYVRRAF